MSKGPKHYIIYESDNNSAAFLKRICNRKHMTQFDVSMALKANPKKVSFMMNNKDFPDYKQMVVMIKQFGATVSDLFGPELAQKLNENTDKAMAYKNQPKVGQTPEKYVDVTLACQKKPEVAKPEPPKKEPLVNARKKSFISKLAMLFSANKERR